MTILRYKGLIYNVNFKLHSPKLLKRGMKHKYKKSFHDVRLVRKSIMENVKVIRHQPSNAAVSFFTAW